MTPRTSTFVWAVVAAVAAGLGAHAAAAGTRGAHLALGLGALMICVGARRVVGPGAGRGFAVGFALLLPLALLGAFGAADVVLLGGGLGADTSKLDRAGGVAFVGALAAGALGPALTGAFRRRSHGPNPLSWGLLVLAAGIGVASLLSLERLRARPAPDDLRGALVTHAEIPRRPVPDRCLLPGRGTRLDRLDQTCDEAILEDDDARLVRTCHSERKCRLRVDLRDGLGLRLDGVSVAPGQALTLLRDMRSELWAVAVAEREGSAPTERIVAAVTRGDRAAAGLVRARSVRGLVAPDPDAVVLGALAIAVALYGASRLRGFAKRIAAVQAGRDAELLDGGWVNVEGERALGRSFAKAADAGALGPLVVEALDRREGYRVTGVAPVGIVARGKKAEVVSGLDSERRDLGAAFLVAALHLAVPLVANALVGRVL